MQTYNYANFAAYCCNVLPQYISPTWTGTLADVIDQVGVLTPVPVNYIAYVTCMRRYASDTAISNYMKSAFQTLGITFVELIPSAATVLFDEQAQTSMTSPVSDTVLRQQELQKHAYLFLQSLPSNESFSEVVLKIAALSKTPSQTLDQAIQQQLDIWKTYLS